MTNQTEVEANWKQSFLRSRRGWLPTLFVCLCLIFLTSLQGRLPYVGWAWFNLYLFLFVVSTAGLVCNWGAIVFATVVLVLIGSSTEVSGMSPGDSIMICAIVGPVLGFACEAIMSSTKQKESTFAHSYSVDTL